MDNLWWIIYSQNPKLREFESVNVVLERLCVTIYCYLHVLIPFYFYWAYVKIRPSLSLVDTRPWTISFHYVMLADCGFLCKRPRLDFPRQFKGCDCVFYLGCLVLVPRAF